MITKILPSVKKKYQLYEVFYTENFVECVLEDREKKICKNFCIDKEEFKTILMQSIADNLRET